MSNYFIFRFKSVNIDIIFCQRLSGLFRTRLNSNLLCNMYENKRI